MCGIAGIVDLAGRRPVPVEKINAMATALVHRGPDEEGFLLLPGLAMANRRLSIVGLTDGRQPIHNEDGSVAVVFNGELFDYPEKRKELEAGGHVFRTHSDTELLPHLWEDLNEAMLARLCGQFAFALIDQRQQRLILAHDHFGICPLYWTQQGDWLLFASEIKALMASGMVAIRPNPRGLNHVFTFFAVPGPVTCFEGIHLLQAGHYLDIHLKPSNRSSAGRGRVLERVYWEIDFPDAGDEDRCKSRQEMVDGFEDVLKRAVQRRLRADVPVVSYLSGGVDSSLVVALANNQRDTPIPTFSIRVKATHLDESKEAASVARYVGSPIHSVDYGAREILANYPRLIRAAEAPVLDTSCAALMLLAQEVHRQGFKAALTGEGADEWLAGYSWYKLHRALSFLDVVPGLEFSQAARRAYMRLIGVPRFPNSVIRQLHELVGGHNPWLDVYGLVSSSKLIFFSQALRESVLAESPYADLDLNRERLRCWHPLNRALYLGGRIHLPGLLLHAKGDRVSMRSSVETRYPFLDLEVFQYLARIHPRWKLRGFKDKWLLRKLAERWLPRQIAWRPKLMFRAPLDSFFIDPLPAWVGQLLSPESLARTGYFDVPAVRHWVTGCRNLRKGGKARLAIEMGLVGVLSTQLWHHTFIDGNLAELPTWAGLTPWPVATTPNPAAFVGVGRG